LRIPISNGFLHSPRSLVRLNPAAIVTSGTEATLAAQQATERIPIVTGSDSEHVSMGFARTLARPGGNVTGLTTQNPDLIGKRVDLLRELLPRMTRLAVLWHSSLHGASLSFREVANRIQPMLNIGVRKREEIADALSTAAREQAGALLLIGSPLMFDQRDQVSSLALKLKLPGIGPARTGPSPVSSLHTESTSSTCSREPPAMWTRS
jgi:putative ABC transport system substrate-binding protein